jgi:hypothetical protein
VIKTNSFYSEIAKSRSTIDFSYFPASADKKMKLWNKTVSAVAQGDTGIITVSVFHTDQNQAELISNAINNVLITKNNLYIGEGDRVKIKVLNDPIVSRWPVQPNLVFIFSMSLVFGFIFFVCYLMLYPLRMEYSRVRPENFVRNGLNIQKENRDKLMESILAPEENIEIINSNVNNYTKSNVEPPVREQSAAQPAPEIFTQEPDLKIPNQAHEETGERELSYEDIIKKGNIQNIFGNQDSDE